MISFDSQIRFRYTDCFYKNGNITVLRKKHVELGIWTHDLRALGFRWVEAQLVEQ